MVLPNRFKIAFKVISSLMAGIFLFQQIAWAGDLIETVLDKQYKEQSQVFAPSYLKAQQSAAEALVAQKQNIEDSIINNNIKLADNVAKQSQNDVEIELKGPRGDGGNNLALAPLPQAAEPAAGQTPPIPDSSVLSITTAEGDIIYYKGGVIDHIERSDGTIIKNILLGQDNSLVGALFEYADGSTCEVREGRVFSFNRPGGATYYYNSDSLIDYSVSADGKVTTYNYIKDDSGNVLETILTDSEKTIHYNSEGKLIKVIFASGKTIEYDNGILSKVTDEAGRVYIYEKNTDPDNPGGYIVNLKEILYAGIKYAFDNNNIASIDIIAGNGHVTDFELDAKGNIVAGIIIYGDGTKVIIEDGHIKRIEPDAAEDTFFDYKTAGAITEVYKRYEYDKNDIGQNFTTINPIDYSSNPVLGAIFRFDPSRPAASMSIYAYSFNYGDKSVSLGLYITGAVPLIRYSCYNYKTKQSTYEERQLTGITIVKDTEYKAEYIWSQTGVNIYLYETAFARPALPIYTISDFAWSPTLQIIGQNAGISIDPSSSGVYRKTMNMAIDYANPPISSPIHISEFKFYADASRRSLNYMISGRTDLIYDSISLSLWPNGTPKLYINHYDYATKKSTLNIINLDNLTFNTDSTYVVEAKKEDGVVSLYVYEKGSAMPAQPIYTMSGVEWEPQVSMNIDGGEIYNIEAYDRLNIYRYENLPSDTPLEQVFTEALAPLIDSVTLTLKAADPFIEGLFNASGSLIETHDFTDIPYFDSIIYEENGSIKNITKPNGDTIVYVDGLVDTVSSQSGITNYDYDLSDQGINGVIIDKNGVKAIYDKYGNIAQISSAGMKLGITGDKVTRIEKDDGTIIEDAEFDSDGDIISARISRPDGVVIVYGNGVLTEVHQPDGGDFYYDESGSITRYDKNGVIYEYADIEEAGQAYVIGAVNDADLSGIQDDKEIVYQKYLKLTNGKKRLVQLKRKNGEIINYSYTEDSGGDILSTTVNDNGKTETTYDKDQNIVTSKVLSTVDDPLETISEYEYGRIRRVYKGGDLVYRYSYEFDADGKEITAITDIKNGDIKRYKDELLISVTGFNKLVTTYEYDADKKITKSIVTYIGKTINQYTYTYNGDNTVIEDMDGVRRTYNKDDKLILLEENGRTFAYSYETNADGKEETVQELIRIKDELGTVSNYENGELKTIEETDGTILGDFVFSDDNKIISYSVLKDGTKYFIEGEHIIKVIAPDQTIIEYYTDGWTKSVISAAGERTDYSYEKSQDGSINFVNVAKDGKIATYDKDGRITQIVYDSKTLKYLYEEADPSIIKGYELIDRQSRYFYDTSNRIIKAIDSVGREFNYDYVEDIGHISSAYTSKYTSIDDIVNFTKQNIEFVDSVTEKYLELAPYADPSIPLLLHFNDSDNAAHTTDSSFANHAVIFNGNTHIDSSYNEFLNTGTLALDGSGDYITIPNSPDLDFGTGDFTVETWVKLNSFSGPPHLFSWGYQSGSNYNGIFFNSDTGTFRLYIGGASVSISGTTRIDVNTWYHIAATRSGNTFRLFVNGVQENSATSSVSLNNNTDWHIGGLGFGYAEDTNGYMKEVRVSRFARYTSNFTPPTEKYNNIFYKTSGSLVSNAIELNAIELKTISWNEYAPEGTDITVQTRTGDTPNPLDGTWSAWSSELSDPVASRILSPAAKFIQYKVNFKSQNPSVSARLIADSNDSFVKINYVENLSNIFNAATNGMNVNIELANLNNVDTLRLASYADPSIPLLLHLNGDNNSVITSDSSYASHDVVFNGNARLDTTVAKFGSSSLYLDGSGDYLRLANSPDWKFETEDFTIDFWTKLNNTNGRQTFMSWDYVSASNLNCIDKDRDNKLSVYLGGYGWINGTTILSANTWYHIAVARSGNTFTLYLNGNIEAQATSDSYLDNVGDMYIGTLPNYPYYVNGYMDEIRITKGKALWTAPFTPPAEEYQGLFDPSGTIISNPIAIVATEIGSIVANTNLPVGTSITLKTRTGASADLNDGTWSDWSIAVKNTSGWAVNSPPNKYLQYQLTLETGDITKTPSLYSDGDSILKLSYSYNRSFDANAPPDDLIFKEYLKVTPPNISSTLELLNLKQDFTGINEVPSNIESRLLPDDAIIQIKSFKDDLGRDVSLQISRDNKFTYLVDGKIISVHQKYDDGHVVLIMEYTYDEEGNLLSVNLPYARDSIDAEIAKARQKIAEEKIKYLRTLFDQSDSAYIQIRDQVQAIRDQINTQRSSLQSMLYQEVTRSRWVGWWIFGWYETYTETVEIPEVRAALNQLDEQERELNNSEAAAYAELSGTVLSEKEALLQNEEAALAEVAAQENEFQRQIVAEESMPVILEYYRVILGRDPDDAETQEWLATVDYNSSINVDTLKTTLLNSAERTEQEAFVAALKNSIRDALYNYINSDEAGKGSALQALGLTPQEVVSLGSEEVDSILSFLDKQNIHFGRSAFVALNTILSSLRAAEGGEAISLADLALKTILIDIFTGSLNPLSENKLLELSMYSLSKAAESYGVPLNNTKLNFDDLRAISSLRAPEGGEAIPLNIIAHLKNNHYVVVTNIAADGKVTYREHNRGQNGYSWTVSKEDFENSWTGYAIVQGDLLGGGTGLSNPSPEVGAIIASKKISDDTAMRVKGSCLEWLFVAIAWLCGSIAAAATAAVGAISAIVAGISAVIGPIIAGIGAFIGNIAGFMVGIGSQLFSAIQFIGSSLLSGLGQVGGWLSGIGSWFGGIGSAIFGSSGLGGVLSATGFNISGLGLALGKTIVTVALSIGVSRGLEALGVSPVFSNLISAFVTGGVSGIFNSGFSALSFVTGGLQGLAIQGVNQLGAALGVDPMLSSVISMAASAFIGAIGNNISPITGQFNLEGFSASIGKDIFPTIAGDFTFMGLTKTLNLFGVDSRLSYAASTFMSSLIGNALSGIDMINSFSRAINSSIVSVGVSLLEGIDPAFSAIRSTGLMNAIENILNEAGLFNGVFTILNKVASSVFNTVGALVSNIFNGAKTFIELITENGPLDSMNSALNSLFTRETVESVVAQGGMENILGKPMNSVVLQDGSIGKELILSDGASMIFNGSGELVSIEEGGVTCTGSFVWTMERGIQLRDGIVEGSLETGYNIWADIEGGTTRKIKVKDKDSNQVFEILPEKPDGFISMRSIFNNGSLEFTFLIVNALVYFANSYMAKINEELVKSITQKINAISAGSLFNNANKFLYALVNGICNPEVDKTKPPLGIRNLMDDLVLHSNYAISKEKDMLPIPLYQGMTPIVPINGFFDAIKWLVESQYRYKSSLVKKAQADIIAYFITHPSEWNRPVAAMGYSGGFMPLVEAISDPLYNVYNVKTLVGIGAPTAYMPGIIPAALLQLITAVVANNLSGAITILAGMGIGYAVTNIDQIKDIVVTKVRELVQQSNLSGETPPFVLGSKTDLIVNVWGTEDIFHKIGVADKRDNFLGKTTYNIEIVGAEHGDYIRHHDLNDISPAATWNNTVADFVTDLILYSEDENQLRQFFDRNADKVSLDTARGVYVVRLPGSGV